MRYIFLSPHIDDAVLSAGSFLVELIAKKTDILLVTVFSEFGIRPITRDSKKYLFRSGFFRLSSFSRARKAEEERVTRFLGISSLLLGFVDGGFRKTPSGDHVYPNHRTLMAGTVSNNDTLLIRAIKRKLQTIIKPRDILLAPLGIGGHADHIIVNRVTQSFPNKTFYWLDQLYAKNLHMDHLDIPGYTLHRTIPHSSKKERLIRMYTSQFSQFFPSECINLPEEKIYI